jgi:long-chain acyl-CoA synthetase
MQGIRRPHPHMPPEADDLATIAYDMSTQGKIKGVMLSHRNLLSSSRALVYQGRSRLSLTCEDVHISYIPLHMRIERSVLALVFSVGASLGFSQEVPPAPPSPLFYLFINEFLCNFFTFSL